LTPPQRDEAVRFLTAAVAVRPESPGAQNNLGAVLFRKGRLDEAMACWKKAIALDLTNTMPRHNLAIAHFNLGNGLRDQGQVDAAIANFRTAIEFDPTSADPHVNLGAILCDVKRDYDAAIASFRTAIALHPKFAYAHNNLGEALRHKGQVDAAIACFKKALALDPKFAGARTELAKVERLAAVQDKLPAFLKGDFQPTTNDERLGLAGWCQIRKHYRTSAGLSAVAFAADPKLADDLKAGHRYSAACSAALAAAGPGEDAAKLDDKEKARLRKEALDWLRADLALRTRQLESGQPADRAEVQQTLMQWQLDRDLAGLRDTAALARLRAEERAACEKLWADVAALLKVAQTLAMKESKR
jgi:Tfp pilus assembly protein PilF